MITLLSGHQPKTPTQARYAYRAAFKKATKSELRLMTKAPFPGGTLQASCELVGLDLPREDHAPALTVRAAEIWNY